MNVYLYLGLDNIFQTFNAISKVFQIWKVSNTFPILFQTDFRSQLITRRHTRDVLDAILAKAKFKLYTELPEQSTMASE